MAANVGKFFESVGNFFSGGDQIPWCDRDVIAMCEPTREHGYHLTKVKVVPHDLEPWWDLTVLKD
ncbi:hypothetical protein Prudu_012837 [Prunus dulcis]|uniref:Uncharacterized protein n=1 Tax=Prunus dulcis TaxID=3755 RepID=A0A4Y1REI5_PRUDU|nr:hypothetical protein Prudu_012837 [Prunus dulcis]